MLPHHLMGYKLLAELHVVIDGVISEQLLDQLLHRIPTLADVEPQELRTWTESFTPDGKYIMGPAPEVQFHSSYTVCNNNTVPYNVVQYVK